MVRYSLTIINIKKETSNSSTVIFKQPSLRKIRYKAGQYISVIILINGRRYVRPYSISSSPSVDKDIEITVKRVLNGIVSNFIIDNFRVGDVVEVIGPMGDFVCQNLDHIIKYYLWGVGSGITPLYSIAKEILKTQPDSLVHLIYGNKQKSTTIFLDQLVQLQDQYGFRLSLNLLYSQSNDIVNSQIRRGRVTSSFISSLITENDSQTPSQHYICGPSGFIEVVKGTLIECNVEPDSIFIEKFELEIDSKELENTKDCQVNLTIDGLLSTFFVKKGKNILEVALDNNIDIPYSCQTGNCNSCKAKLVGGQLKMLGLEKHREELFPDEFLLCCSYPISENIDLIIN